MKLTDIVNEARVKKNKSSWVQPDLKPWMYQTKEEIEQWLKDSKIPGFVSKELEIHPTGSGLQLGNIFSKGPKETLVQYNGQWLLPVRFNTSPGNLESNNLAIESMIGFPRSVLGRMILSDVAIENFEGCPKLIQGAANAWDADIVIDSSKPIKSFVGCPDVKKIEVWSKVDSIDGLPLTLLSLSLSHYTNIREIIGRCPKLQNLTLAVVKPGENGLRPLDVFKSKILTSVFFFPENWSINILPNEYKEGNAIINTHLKSKERNVLSCQEELIDNGLKNWAD